MRSISVALAVLLGVGAAAAGEHRFTASDPVWKAECGSCHVAYPPQLLPAQSWRKIMARLDRLGPPGRLVSPGPERHQLNPRARATAPQAPRVRGMGLSNRLSMSQNLITRASILPMAIPGPPRHHAMIQGSRVFGSSIGRLRRSAG